MQPGDYLLEGKYAYVGRNFYFRIEDDIIKASSLTSLAFVSVVQPVDNSKIFPETISCPESFKEETLCLQLTKEDAKAIKGAVAGGEEPIPAQWYRRAIMVKGFELSYTDGLCVWLETFLGPKYKMYHRQSVLQKDFPVCKYATSQPDIGFYYLEKFAVENTIIACSVESVAGGVSSLELEDKQRCMIKSGGESQPSQPHTLFGHGGEDKLKSGGEPQAIAAMLVMACQIGTQAALNGKYFDKAIIFGNCREAEGNMVTPYKLTIHFTERYTAVYKGSQMNCFTYFSSVKHFLENPDELL
jgi:hypothetical protein